MLFRDSVLQMHVVDGLFWQSNSGIFVQARFNPEWLKK